MNGFSCSFSQKYSKLTLGLTFSHPKIPKNICRLFFNFLFFFVEKFMCIGLKLQRGGVIIVK